MLFAALPAFILATLASASVLTLQSPRLTVQTSTGEQLRSEPLSLAHKLPHSVKLSPTDTLKLTFQIVEKEEGNGVQPHQTFLRFYDKQTGEEGIHPLKVSSGGKVKFDLNMARPPTSIPPTPDPSVPLSVSLIVGSFNHSPINAQLFDLYLPQSQPAPVHPDEVTYHPQPELFHTFRAEQKLPNKVFSLVGAIAVLAPWPVLAFFLSQLETPIPNLFSSSILPFVATLVAFEGLLVWYWVALRLGQVLTYGALLGFVSLFTGKRALASIAQKRQKGKKNQ